MDKFSKTTEIDISDAMGMEDDTPKKSIKWKVVAIVMSVLIAICIWLYVMQTDTALYDREYKNVSVTVVNADGYDVVVSDTVTVKLRGTKSNLADIKFNDCSSNCPLFNLFTHVEPLKHTSILLPLSSIGISSSGTICAITPFPPNLLDILSPV